MRALLFWVVLIIAKWAGETSFAWANPEVSSSLRPAEISVGETATLEVAAAWAPSENTYRFLFPQIETDGLKLVKQGESQESYARPDGTLWHRKKFSIVLQADGSTQLARVKSFPLIFIDQASGKKSEHLIPEISVPIHGKKLSFFSVMVIGSGLCLLAGSLGWGIRRIFFSKQKHLREVNEKSFFTYVQVLLDQLDHAPHGSESLTAFDQALREELFKRNWLTADYRTMGSNNLAAQIRNCRELSRPEMDEVCALFTELERLKFGGSVLSPTEVKSIARQILTWADKHRTVSFT